MTNLYVKIVLSALSLLQMGCSGEILEGDETIVIEVANPDDYIGVPFPEPVTITIDDAEGTYVFE